MSTWVEGGVLLRQERAGAAAVRVRRGYEVSKRVFDLGFAFAVLILASPVWLLAAAAIRFTSGAPVLFRQVRCGRHGRPFVCYKFRTMVVGAEHLRRDLEPHNETSGPVFKMRRDPRVTAVGSWLRRFSIDELPNFLNVLRGDLSIVGPRPPLPSEVARYTPSDWQRLAVTPGITCIWQVSGRSDIGFEDWVALDLEYIRRRSLWFDLRLILRTVPAVLTGRGAA